MEWSILDAVPVDLPDVKVFLYLLDSTGDYVVSSTPNTIAFRFALLFAVRLITSWSRRHGLHDRPKSPRTTSRSVSPPCLAPPAYLDGPRLTQQILAWRKFQKELNKLLPCLCQVSTHNNMPRPDGVPAKSGVRSL